MLCQPQVPPPPLAGIQWPRVTPRAQEPRVSPCPLNLVCHLSLSLWRDTPVGLCHCIPPLLWVKSYPPERYTQVLISVPVNVTILGNRVFAEVIKVGRGCPGWGWALIRKVKFGYKETETEGSWWRHRGTATDCGGGSWSAAITSQRKPELPETTGSWNRWQRALP